MLKRIKTSRFLLCFVLILMISQLITGTFFYTSIVNIGNDFSAVILIKQRIDLVNDSAANLQQARLDASRAAARFDNNRIAQGEAILNTAMAALKKSKEEWDTADAIPSRVNPELLSELSKNYNVYHLSIEKMLNILKNNSMEEFHNYDITPQREAFDIIYSKYLSNVDLIVSEMNDSVDEFIKKISFIIISLIFIFLLIILAILFGFKKLLTSPLDRAINYIHDISNGNLTNNIDKSGFNEIYLLTDALDNMQNSLADIVDNVRSGTDAIYTGISEIATGNNDLSSRTEQQASALEETAASMEELTSTVKQNAENALQASHLSQNASDTARKGSLVVDSVVQTMRDISGSSQKISDIISVIDGIAFQTNILALNAAVEAARAGEQGRGFAVVAGEVRNLAQRSAQAAREIKNLIEDSVSRVDVGSKQAESAGETMTEVVSAVTRVTDIMGEIASASEEQSRGIDQVGRAVSEMDTVTQQNAALVQESASAAAAAALEDQAGRLTDAVAIFNIRNALQSPVQKTKAASFVTNTQVTPHHAMPAGSKEKYEEEWEAF
ncbi:TPA: Tar ligand binding domain-containing protein [Morganella morganii]|nr:Tar ligand binding domain-containing protein [Morganella morganii]